jgi:hypothetical protein
MGPGLTDWMAGARDVPLRFARAALKLIVAWLAIFVALALCIEGATRLVFAYVPPSPKDYRSSRPPAYRNSPFFSQAFIDEQFSHRPWVVLPERRMVYPADYHGRWYNDEGGMRRTANVPATDRHILLVGSSTVYGAEVPDEYTIASYLQKRINDQGGVKYAVQNFGAEGVTVAQQLERLKTLDFGERDVVLFYDGTSDAVQGVMYANIDGWIVEENRKHLNDYVVKHQAQLQWLARHCRFCDWLFVQTTDYLPEHMKHPDRIKALAEQTRDKMFDRLLQSDAYVRSRGARFIHVLQPDLFTRPLRDFERPLVENHFLTMKGMDTALLEAHREFAPLTQMLVERKVSAYDATKLFDQVNDPVFLDFAHTNELGNRIIADFLFDALVREGVVSDSRAASVPAPAANHEPHGDR